MQTPFFSQQIKFNRALCPVYGDLYQSVKKPVVNRCIMGLKSEQASSVMVQAGKPYVVFITCHEAFLGDTCGHNHFFATQQEATDFATYQLANHPAIVR